MTTLIYSTIRFRRITYTLAYNSDIKLGTFLYSDCKSYSELVRVSAVNKVYEKASSVKTFKRFFYFLCCMFPKYGFYNCDFQIIIVPNKCMCNLNPV